MDIFLNLDVFTVNSFFQYEKNRKVASYPGLFFSIIVFILLIYTFIKSDMVQKTNPKITDIIISNTDLNNGISSDFRITIGYNHGNYVSYIQYFDPQIWSLNFFSGNSTITIVNCSSQNESLCLNGSSKINNLDNIARGFLIRTCVNSSDSNITCKSEEEIYDFVRGIMVKLEFKETFFDLNNYDNPIENKYSSVAFIILNPNFAEYYDLNIMTIEFAEDKNFFYVEDLVPKQYYQQDYKGSKSTFYLKKSINDSDPTFDFFLFIRIYASPNKRVMSRVYQDLTQILGTLGGLFNALRLFGGLILSIFPYFRIKKHFINKLYYLPKKNNSNDESFKEESAKLKKIDLEKKDLPRNNNKKEEAEKEKKNENENSIFSFLIPRSSNIQNDDEKDFEEENKNAEIKIPDQLEQNENLVQEKKKSQFSQSIENLKKKIQKNNEVKPFKFSFYNYMKNKMKSKLRMKVDSGGQIMLSADKIYDKETDIILLSKRIQDIEKLKCIFLNKEQRILFDLIKPTIMIDNKNQEKNGSSASRGKLFELSEILKKSLDIGQNPNNEIEEMQNVLSVYEEKINNDEGEMKEIDKTLLEFFKE